MVGEPDAGKPHVRFDEGAQETYRCGYAPALHSTHEPPCWRTATFLMARHEHLPIYYAAFDLAVHVEKIVKNVSRYHKYTLGTELRDGSRLVLQTFIEAKVTARLAQKSEAFASARAHLHVAEQVVACRWSGVGEFLGAAPWHTGGTLANEKRQ